MMTCLAIVGAMACIWLAGVIVTVIIVMIAKDNEKDLDHERVNRV